MAIVYINVEYAKTRDEEKVSSSENDTTTKNTTKVSDEERGGCGQNSGLL